MKDQTFEIKVEDLLNQGAVDEITFGNEVAKSFPKNEKIQSFGNEILSHH